VSRPALAVLVTALAAAVPAFAQETRSGAATVIDGATLEIDGVRLRLDGVWIDGPDTPTGWTARLALGGLVSGGPVTCALQTAERWRCLTATGFDLAAPLVRFGLAAAAGPAYQYEQTLAVAAGVGLWREAGDGGR